MIDNHAGRERTTMDDRFKATGYWWSRSTPDDRWAGTLTYDSENGARLAVTVQAPPPTFSRELRDYDVLHGISNAGERISLLRCFDRASRFSFSGIGTREIYANQVLKGFLVDAPDPEIASAEAVFENFATWIGQSGFDVTWSSRITDLDIRYRAPAQIELYSDDDLRIETYHTLESIPSRPDADGRVNLQEHVRVRFIPSAPQPLSAFLDQVGTLQDLLSIACLRFCPCGRLTLVSADSKDEEAEHATFHGVPTLRPPTLRSSMPIEFLFRYSDLGSRVRDVLARWLGAADRTRPVRKLYLSALYGDRVLDAKFLSLTQGLEVFHRRLRRGTYVEEALFERKIFPKLLAGVPKDLPSDFYQAIRDRLKYANEYSLRKRLRILLAEHQGIVDSYVRDARELIEFAVNIGTGCLITQARIKAYTMPVDCWTVSPSCHYYLN